MARIKTGIFGLDQLIEGGVRDNTAIVIVGSSGTGKTTFAMQFLMHGIENGEQGLYVTMEESPEQLMKEAEMLGWDMRKHYEKSLFFIHLKGKNFKKMIDEQIPQLVKARSDYDIKTRVVIDPMTPVIWATEDKLQQRELIGKLFYTLKELGVVMATVEEHSRPGELIGEDVLLPVYLADGAINLEYYPIGGAFNRTLKIIKMRGTHHGEGVYPYIFARGAGAIIRTSPAEAVKAADSEDFGAIFDRAIKTAEDIKAPESVIAKFKKMKETWTYNYSPEEVLQVMFDSYGLK
ncbi:MAG: AAA family ATPase [Candidatus Thermoplasmatota archaeon]|nr:AAA family ATPase [Euryarchaeota archaeon]MBU4032026.1 AAA family ATPase [Candidatus Thermoplasmatota archaeon]MBU4071625.1 AAA family ATPase [Candidatus Thermoplasmatota archaeon]MBU4143885.1 AAA family ATPase [Candidatus Thermoplasmatota archaeon]MBU4592506.1 AAA family ATPase [Candidatus Thermoplasmatota archaeon]